LTGAGYGDIRAANVLVNKSANTGTVDWLTKKGWFYDYPTTGERTNVDPSITGGIITVATNVPSSDVCALGGSSFIYDFDLLSGNFKVHNMGSTLTVGITVVQLAKDGANSGSLITISTNSKGDLTTTDTSSYSGSTGLRRTSWRELD
jgi:type IV pilus assembly protein PilY1